MTHRPVIIAYLLGASLFPGWGMAAEPASPAGDAAVRTASLVDVHLAEHWQTAGVGPAPPADDAEFLRRATLDLTGRIPAADERRAFAAAPAASRRSELIDRLLTGPEFPLHFARVIDDWLQRDHRGDDAFVEWLRAGLAARRPYDALFTAMLVGPWETDAERAANRFLTKRAKNIDALTADGSRAFFGVDITCARCHDHPLVDDWKQEHYYGLASFFHRTHLTGSKGSEIGEKKDGEMTFAVKGSSQRTARPMFLDGTLIAAEEPAPADKSSQAEPIGRRRQLVDAALRERKFLSRAAVNRVWAWFFGRGLVEPVDQMHSGNPASVPKLLDALADDFVAEGYDLERLVRQIVGSRAYQATYRGTAPATASTAAAHAADLFLAPELRPLTPQQYALSLVAALTADGLGASRGAERARSYRDLEKLAAEFGNELDPTVEGYQAGYREALYVANHEKFQQLLGAPPDTPQRHTPRPDSLVAKLAALADDEARIDGAFAALLGRSPTAEERRLVLASWRSAAAGATPVRERVADLLWALATSAEFRFNH